MCSARQIADLGRASASRSGKYNAKLKSEIKPAGVPFEGACRPCLFGQKMREIVVVASSKYVKEEDIYTDVFLHLWREKRWILDIVLVVNYASEIVRNSTFWGAQEALYS